jgi:uncharacterized Tic20 family protein
MPMKGANDVFEVDVAAEGQPPTSDERMLATIGYLSYLVGFWLIAPFAIYLWQRERSRFVAFHAIQALALHLMLTVASMCLGAIFFVGFFGGFVVSAVGSKLLGYAIVAVAMLAWLAVLLVPFVWLVKAAWRAWHGERYGAPLAGRVALRVLDASGSQPAEGAIR